jgi:hypothetical protein
MGLRAPLQRSGTIHYFEKPPAAQPPLWRHRAHDLLIEAMMLAGVAAIVYGFVIHPILRHIH